MKSFTFGLAASAALTLAGCGGSQTAADTPADENLAVQAEDTAANLQQMSGNVMDADQANVLVNESMELQNAADEAQNDAGEAGNAH